ncbi:MAG: 50S ribosomal protein L5 [Candidatus Pacearchaeota archaeon]
MRNKEKEDRKEAEIAIEKVILHATTSNQEKLEKYKELLKYITGRTPATTKAKRRIEQFNIRIGLTIGCMVTLRKSNAIELLKRLLAGVKYTLPLSSFGNGIVNFGIKEYIQIPNVEYRRDLGILGFDVSVVLTKKGKRVVYRKLKKSKVGSRQKITREETINFMKEQFGLKLKE